jgi:L-serine dehydratase
MKIASVFNGVLGPVMRGPSSSHTAGSYHIGKLARDILGVRPLSAKIYFDVNGSYGKVYKEQGSDRGFILGLLGRSLLDDEFNDAYGAAERASCEVEFSTGAFSEAVHPNWVKLFLSGEEGRAAAVTAASTGGGSVVVTEIDGFSVNIAGDLWTSVVRCEEAPPVAESLDPYGTVEIKSCPGANLVVLQGADEPPGEAISALREKGLFPRVVVPVFFPVKGEPPFQSAEELEIFASEKNLTPGEAALEYECALLGMPRGEAMGEMRRRYSLMKSALSACWKAGWFPPRSCLRQWRIKYGAPARPANCLFSAPARKPPCAPWR